MEAVGARQARRAEEVLAWELQTQGMPASGTQTQPSHPPTKYQSQGHRCSGQVSLIIITPHMYTVGF